MLAPALGVRADVEQRHRSIGYRQRQRKRRTVDARRALDVERPRGQRGAGPASADERLSGALGDRPGGLDDRRLRRRPDGARGVGALSDRHRRVDDPHAWRCLAELGGGPEEDHVRAASGRDRRARGDLSRSQVGAIAVDRDGQDSRLLRLEVRQ